MGYRPATSSEKPAPTTVASVQVSSVPDATDTNVFLVDGVLSYIGADGNVAALDLAGGGDDPNAAVVAPELKTFGVDAGFTLAAGVTATAAGVKVYKRGGRVWYSGQVQLDHTTDAYSGSAPFLIVPAGYFSVDLYSESIPLWTQGVGGGGTKLDACYFQGEDPVGLWLNGSAPDGTHDWQVSLASVNYRHA